MNVASRDIAKGHRLDALAENRVAASYTAAHRLDAVQAHVRAAVQESHAVGWVALEQVLEVGGGNHQNFGWLRCSVWLGVASVSVVSWRVVIVRWDLCSELIW